MLADPAGIRNYLAMSQIHVLTPPESLVPLSLIRWGTLAATRGALVFRVGVVVLATVMLLCLRRWLFRG